MNEVDPDDMLASAQEVLKGVLRQLSDEEGRSGDIPGWAASLRALVRHTAVASLSVAMCVEATRRGG
jgi:hypothetical protein